MTPREAVIELRDALAVASDAACAVRRFIDAGLLPRELGFQPVCPGDQYNPTRSMRWFERCAAWLAESPEQPAAVRATDAPATVIQVEAVAVDVRDIIALDRTPVSSRNGRAAAAAVTGKPERK